MQRYAVGLQLILKDQDEMSKFSNQFKEASDQLNVLICELQTALHERQLEVPDNVDEDIIPEEYKQYNDDTSKNLRDFVIYEKYLNGLEYLIQVFQNMKDQMS